MSPGPDWFKARFQAELPKGFDDRTTMTFVTRQDSRENDVVIAHPDMPPHKLNRREKKFEPIEPKP